MNFSEFFYRVIIVIGLLLTIGPMIIVALGTAVWEWWSGPRTELQRSAWYDRIPFWIPVILFYGPILLLLMVVL